MVLQLLRVPATHVGDRISFGLLASLTVVGIQGVNQQVQDHCASLPLIIKQNKTKNPTSTSFSKHRSKTLRLNAFFFFFSKVGESMPF